ncbi:hypothetical protein HOP50_01g02030 [Chloropicon primus]|uniref:Uncharacterized protein n=2 Tax=Chloropicon primus TaxID=1764295 RepID=A0A5B8MDJ2_9CHLO|nr:hypothetical protein A3770_01p02130 [Chloropicon primus]UPQ96912.1 hypothetical protein HOP50_01g02030 [Chloropicon primus]|eukprot:QDZ17695.1 hypothetical protein A3770_01p02130 [Chloropicon primus]
MDLHLFLEAQNWISAVEERPEALDTIFRGSASFHVSLEENYKEKSANELKGALAPDAVFVKLRWDRASSLEVPCTIYLCAKLSQASVGADGNDGEAVYIEFKGKLFLLARRTIRYVVSSRPQPRPSRSPRKGKGPSASPRKGGRPREEKLASIIFEGITLNLVESESSGRPGSFQRLISTLVDWAAGGDEGARLSTRKRGRRPGSKRVNGFAGPLLARWLDVMDSAVELIEEGKPKPEELNSFVSSVISHRGGAGGAPPALGEGGDLGDTQEHEEWETKFEGFEGDHEKMTKFLEDHVALQRVKEATRHDLLVASLASAPG